MLLPGKKEKSVAFVEVGEREEGGQGRRGYEEGRRVAGSYMGRDATIQRPICPLPHQEKTK